MENALETRAHAWQYGKPKNRPGVGASLRVSSGESFPSWSMPLLVKYSFPSAFQSYPTVLRMPGNSIVNHTIMLFSGMRDTVGYDWNADIICITLNHTAKDACNRPEHDRAERSRIAAVYSPHAQVIDMWS